MPDRDSSALKARPESDRRSTGRPALGKYLSVELPDEAVAVLNEVMRLTGDTPESLFRKSLGLYKIAVDAREEGNRVAIVDPEDEIVQDINGL